MHWPQRVHSASSSPSARPPGGRTSRALCFRAAQAGEREEAGECRQTAGGQSASAGRGVEPRLRAGAEVDRIDRADVGARVAGLAAARVGGVEVVGDRVHGADARALAAADAGVGVDDAADHAPAARRARAARRAGTGRGTTSAARSTTPRASPRTSRARRAGSRRRAAARRRGARSSTPVTRSTPGRSGRGEVGDVADQPQQPVEQRVEQHGRRARERGERVEEQVRPARERAAAPASRAARRPAARAAETRGRRERCRDLRSAWSSR